MNTQILFFSATGTTKKIVKAFAEGLNCEARFMVITPPDSRKIYPRIDSDLVVIAVPIHGERIHRFVYEYFKQIDGNGRPLVVLSVYGNIGFGISLDQFARYARENHFRLIGAGAFVAEHTYASDEVPVAYGRPDSQDLDQAKDFGRRIREKLESGSLNPVRLPASGLPNFIAKFPDSGIRFLIQQPTVDPLVCKQCGACVRKCPMKAIDPDRYAIDEKKCIRCYACVRGCPQRARKARFRVRLFGTVFKFIGRQRKENQVYL